MAADRVIMDDRGRRHRRRGGCSGWASWRRLRLTSLTIWHGLMSAAVAAWPAVALALPYLVVPKVQPALPSPLGRSRLLLLAVTWCLRQ
jgi:hypothetical protein